MKRPTRDIPVEELTDEQAAADLEALEGEIAEHDRAYYQTDAPRVSDAEYDALRRRHEAIETRFPELVRLGSPSQRVGAAPAAGFAKVAHARPMLSLGNAFDDGEVREFMARVRRFLGLAEDETVEVVGTVTDGHATLIRAPEATRASVSVFHPQPAPLAALTRRIKDGFDPKRILNPGRMYEGV